MPLSFEARDERIEGEGEEDDRDGDEDRVDQGTDVGSQDSQP